MSDTAEHLRAFTIAGTDVSAIIAERMYEDKIPQNVVTNPLPFIWYTTRLETPANVLNGAVGELPDSITFELECVSMNKPTAKDLARLVRARLNNYKSTTATDFGGGSTKGVFVRDKDTDYAPVNGDRGQYVQAFDVEVWL